MSLAVMLEILAVRLKALSLLGTLRLRRKAAAAAAEAAAVAAAVVLPGVRNSAGGGQTTSLFRDLSLCHHHWRPL